MGRAGSAQGAPGPPNGRAGERATPCPRPLVPGVVSAGGRGSREQTGSHRQPLAGREVGAERPALRCLRSGPSGGEQALGKRPGRRCAPE